MKITVTIKPEWADETTNIFELRAEGLVPPVFRAAIKQPIIVSFEQANRTVHIAVPWPAPLYPAAELVGTDNRDSADSKNEGKGE